MSGTMFCAPSNTPRRAAGVTLAALVLALLPASASASSIAFIKDNNVWLIGSDGSRERQLTTDGTAAMSYNWPSQADDGTILVKRGRYFVRLRPDGTRIGDPVAAIGSDTQHSGNLFLMSGPNAPRISPDGTRFAYWLSVRNLNACPIWDPLNCSFRDTDYTLVSRVDRFTEGQEFGAVRDYRDPSWAGNDRLLVFNYGLGIKQAAISHVGAGEAGLRQWFDPPAGRNQIGQGQLSRQGDKLVTLAGDDAFGPAQRELHFYGVPADAAEPPSSKCYVRQGAPPSGKFLMPSWSPDGTAVAVTESDGIHIYGNIPDLRVPDADCHLITDRVLVRGSSPAWGPAEVPGTAAPPPAPPSPLPPAKQDTAAPATPMGGAIVAPRQRGRAVRIRVLEISAGTTVRIRLLGRRRALMGAAVRRHAKPGTLTLTVPLNRRGRTVQRLRGTLRLSVEVSATAPDRRPRSETHTVTLRR